MVRTIALSLISHTNVGKTTLARTLLRRDVGEVRDAAHVTIESERYVLCSVPASPDDIQLPALTLELWDTPGFGDSLRLAQRLEQAGNPLGWFMTEVWDRLRDRAFWSSQKAVRTILEHADLVLYLINASESPQDVGYIDAELNVLRLAGKPVIVLLNQTGQPQTPAQLQAEVRAWRERLDQAANYAQCIKGVLPLDAFTRCWVQEDLLYQTIEQALSGQRRADMVRLRQTIQAHHKQIWHDTMQSLARQLCQTMLDREPLSDQSLSDTFKRLGRPLQDVGEQLAAKAKDGFSALRNPFKGEIKPAKQDAPLDAAASPQPEETAMQALAHRLQIRWADTTNTLLDLHQLDGKAAPDVLQKVASQFDTQASVDKRQAALWGGTVTGLLAGLKADLALGGLTMGGGLLLGGLLGALGAAGLAHGYNRIKGREHSALQWSNDALTQQLESTLLLYLTIAHYGRGRGAWEQPDTPAFWHQSIRQAIDGELELQTDAGKGEDARSSRRRLDMQGINDVPSGQHPRWDDLLAMREQLACAQSAQLERNLLTLLTGLTEALLGHLYPNAQRN